MGRIRAVIRKEFIHIFRDLRTLILIVFMPVMQLIIYGYAVNTDVKHLATVLYDEDQTPLSRRLSQTFEQSAYFDIHWRVQSPDEMRRVLDRGWAKAGIHIPPTFSKDLLSGKHAELQMLIDGTDSNPANTAMNTSQAIVTSFIQQEGLLPIQVLPINFKPRLWYNPDLKTSFFMVPGLVGLLIQLLIPMITGTAVVREKERGNLEQLLVTPIKPYEFIIGKLIPYVFIGIFISLTVLTAARLLFQIPLRGNPLTLFVLTLLFIIVCLGLGLLASTLAENQQQAAQMVMFFAAPSILLSGFIFPRETMPLPIFYLGQMIPLTYYLKIVRGIVLKGLGLHDLWDQIIPLAVMAVVVVTLSIRQFHKRLS
jgi:ABC-2 type transport system permease protein